MHEEWEFNAAGGKLVRRAPHRQAGNREMKPARLTPVFDTPA